MITKNKTSDLIKAGGVALVLMAAAGCTTVSDSVGSITDSVKSVVGGSGAMSSSDLKTLFSQKREVKYIAPSGDLYSQTLRPDGTARQRSANGSAEDGTWKIKGDSVCTTWAKSSPTPMCAGYVKTGATSYSVVDASGGKGKLLF